jgi:hypothetical protein
VRFVPGKGIVRAGFSHCGSRFRRCGTVLGHISHFLFQFFCFPHALVCMGGIALVGKCDFDRKDSDG